MYGFLLAGYATVPWPSLASAPVSFLLKQSGGWAKGEGGGTNRAYFVDHRAISEQRGGVSGQGAPCVRYVTNWRLQRDMCFDFARFFAAIDRDDLTEHACKIRGLKTNLGPSAAVTTVENLRSGFKIQLKSVALRFFKNSAWGHILSKFRNYTAKWGRVLQLTVYNLLLYTCCTNIFEDRESK